MNRDEAHRIVRETFQNSFDKRRFRYFIKNLLVGLDESKAFPLLRGQYIYEPFRPRIKQYERIGTYTDPDGMKIDVLIVYLQKQTTLDYGRTTQRNFIAKYLKERGEKDAGLVAFVSPDSEDWRFSLVRMDYRLTPTPKGAPKAALNFTPARRWSFLVGSRENSHTVQSRLVPVMTEPGSDRPTLSRLEDMFNIETVTKEFFEKYRELFLRTREVLDTIVSANPIVAEDLAAKGVNTVDFSKKLLGQIVFLYFLQKKGWFGVERDAGWGAGPRDFLRELFERKHCTYKNFFNDVLEPLFYQALRQDRRDDDNYYDKLSCKIPFLNGGLFDPIGGYDWVHADILFPNELFSNEEKTKEGDTGDGIFDVFDRYNFTVKEDEPLEKEVAVDPEMLGKVFENLLEVKDRKSKGTYYTPREIVHYMCRQCLISYLETELGCTTVASEKLGDNQLDMFGNKAKTGQMDLVIEHKVGPSIPRRDIEMLIHFGEQIGENEAAVEARGRETDTYSYKLPESIRQNAGLIDRKLAEIKVCDPAVGSGAFLVGMMNEIVKTRNVLTIFIKEPNRTHYAFKRECIEKSLYGVDIDPGAAEIAKLRMWLSLVVDEEDIREIKPLPNLDYKIVCGNSLGSIRRDILNDHLFSELESLKTRFFGETSPGKKKEDKTRIDTLISKLTNNDTHFDYKIYFSEIFDHRGGFNVVIANPPYGLSLPKQLKKEFATFSSRGESYILFIERGLNLLAIEGHLSFIVPDTYLNLSFASALRNHLLGRSKIEEIIVLPARVFESATVDTTLLFAQNAILNRDFHPCEVRVKLFTKQERLFDIEHPSQEGTVHTSSWYQQGTFNVRTNPQVDALLMRLAQRFSKIKLVADLFSGIKVYEVGKGIPPQTQEVKITKPFTSSSKLHDGFYPFLDGKHIARYRILWQGNNWINYGPWLAAPRNPQHFIGEKILIRKIVADTLIGAYLPDTSYCNTLLHVLKLKPNTSLSYPFVLGVLNSRLIGWYFKTRFQISAEDTFPQIMISDIAELPIPQISAEMQAPINALVQRILDEPDSLEVPNLERQIDGCVYQVYELSEQEIALVEGN